MLIILLLQSSFALNLVDFYSFQVDFDAACPEYLTLLGNHDFLYLAHDSDNLTLRMGRNKSHVLFTGVWTDRFLFAWPEMEINGNSMIQVASFGEIDYPLTYNISSLHCSVAGVRAGSLNMGPADVSTLTYQCENLANWKIYLPAALTVVVLMMAVASGYKNVRSRMDDARYGEVMDPSEEPCRLESLV